MKRAFLTLVAFLFVTTSLFGQIDTNSVNGWYIVDTLNVWEASSRVVSGSNIGGGNNYQIFRLKTYDSGKPSYVEFEKKIEKIKTPIGLTWYGSLVSALPKQNTMVSYQFSVGGADSFFYTPRSAYLGSDNFLLLQSEGYFQSVLPDSIDHIRLRIYPGPLGDPIRIMELGFDFLHGINDSGTYFLIDSFEDTTIVGIEDESGLPSDFRLFQNYPNPFNPQTSIRYTVLSSTYVNLIVYDILGREVTTLVNEEKYSGMYEVVFDASHLSSGIYFCRLTTGKYTETKKMVLQK